MLARKLVVPEVYDLMGQVQALMIRSQAAPIRQACSTVSPQALPQSSAHMLVLRAPRPSLPFHGADATCLQYEKALLYARWCASPHCCALC